MSETISLEELSRFELHRTGLLVGPAATKTPDKLREVCAALRQEFAIDNLAHFWAAGDHLASAAERQRARNVIRDQLATGTSPNLDGLALVEWGAVLSASLDLELEDLLRAEADRHPTRRKVFVSSSLRAETQPRVLPVYKMLGAVQRDDFVSSKAEYLRAKGRWRPLMRAFMDKVQGAPLFCTGFEESEDLLQDLLAELLADARTAPSAVLFLEGDIVANNSVIRELLEGTPPVVVRAPRGEFLQLLRSPASPQQLRAQASSSGSTALKRFRHIVTKVPDAAALDAKAGERNRLLNLLFSPELPNWEPFSLDMDFRRSMEPDLADMLSRKLQGGGFSSSVLSVRGGAASGKTTLVKRVAYNLACSGVDVFWLRPAYHPDNSRLVYELCAALAKENKRVVMVMDDPMSFTGVHPRLVASACAAAGLEVLLVVVCRTSEWATRGEDGLTGGLPVTGEAVVPDDLEQGEPERLQSYLVELGVAPTLEDARHAFSRTESLHAQDTLALMYWLIPETRAAISESLRSEYFRLGDVAGFTSVIIGAADASSELLREAYELTAISCLYRAALPLEVLVSALGVSYAEFLEAFRPDGPSWGILYPEDDEEHTVTVRTRNAVVDQQIAKAVNGGALSRSGELRCLRRLLEGCDGTNAVYREYACRILINNDVLSERLDYADGLALFESAQSALPFEDRSLLHHKGIWERDKGRDPLAAQRTLHKALDATDYPYAERTEIEEHIYTTLASNSLRAVDLGKISLDEGKEQILRYLDQARSPRLVNAHAAHVHANTILKLAAKLDADDKVDLFALKNEALAEIDHVIDALGASSLDAGDRSSSLDLLKRVREEILIQHTDQALLEQQAEEVWESFRSQSGFALAGRALFSRARFRGKGGDFLAADEYLSAAIERVRGEGVDPERRLLEVHLQNLYYWRVRRATEQPKSTGAEINWRTIRDECGSILGRDRKETEPFFLYLSGLANAHLGNWQDASAVFGALRGMRLPPHVLHHPRDLLLNRHGMIRAVQGRVRRGGGQQTFLYVQDLDTDFPAARGVTWPAAGLETTAYVRFSFAGPLAVKDRNV